MAGKRSGGQRNNLAGGHLRAERADLPETAGIPHMANPVAPALCRPVGAPGSSRAQASRAQAVQMATFRIYGGRWPPDDPHDLTPGARGTTSLRSAPSDGPHLTEAATALDQRIQEVPSAVTPGPTWYRARLSLGPGLSILDSLFSEIFSGTYAI